MPEIDQYSFTQKELLELMIKKAGVHTGKWMFQITFAFTAANMGPNADSVMPAGVVAAQTYGIVKAPADAPAALVLDAAEVNPASSA